MPASSQSKWAEFDGLRLRNLGKLFDNTTAALQTILNESVQYGDLLIGDFTDSYYNLTIKQVTTFRWISAFCRYTSALYLFIDNDYSLVPQNLIKMIQDIPDAIKLYLNGGTFGPARGVLRPKNRTYGGRYDVSLDEIPWDMYPQYSSGAAYMVGASLVTDAAIAMAYTRFLRIDDAYLGFVWDKLHVPILTIPGMLHTVVNFPHTEHVISLPSKEADKLVDWNTGRIQKKNITIAPELRDSLVIGG
ncbi:Hexosyltransferase [Fasciola hepatica]|uniref:Hexosyltransferase n=1 Tax=Fasciola hepatica TaxID=6192 RepID=A0A2H1BT57_FASHE|nr:Hexosyltransferase [Fasciola hepatica]